MVQSSPSLSRSLDSYEHRHQMRGVRSSDGLSVQGSKSGCISLGLERMPFWSGCLREKGWRRLETVLSTQALRKTDGVDGQWERDRPRIQVPALRPGSSAILRKSSGSTFTCALGITVH